MTLDSKRIIVTGAATASGGRPLALVAARGAQVAAFDVNDTDGPPSWMASTGREARRGTGTSTSRSKTRCRPPWPAPPIGWAADRMCCCISRASCTGAWVDIADFPEVTWDRVLDINLKGSFLVSKHVATRMQQNGAGVIVLTASGAGVIGGSSSYAYGSSKGGVHGLAMVLRGHLADRGVRVNDVCPGNVESPLKMEVIEQAYRRTGDRAAYEADIAGLVQPEGIAKVMAWLASDEAADVTGTIFTR